MRGWQNLETFDEGPVVRRDGSTLLSSLEPPRQKHNPRKTEAHQGRHYYHLLRHGVLLEADTSHVCRHSKALRRH